jgi:hypothetical protein
MNRRTLLLLLIVVAGVVVVLFVVRGGSTSLSSKATAVPATSASGTVTPRKTAVRVSPADRALRMYAAALLPTVNRGARTFDAVTGKAAAAANLDELNVVCSGNLRRLGLAQAQIEGVPHASPWYSKVGKYHHRVLGVYHIMVGATDACVTSTSNKQANDASVAVSDMGRATRQIHSLQKDLKKLASLPH